MKWPVLINRAVSEHEVYMLRNPAELFLVRQLLFRQLPSLAGWSDQHSRDKFIALKLAASLIPSGFWKPCQIGRFRPELTGGRARYAPAARARYVADGSARYARILSKDPDQGRVPDGAKLHPALGPDPWSAWSSKPWVPDEAKASSQGLSDQAS